MSKSVGRAAIASEIHSSQSPSNNMVSKSSETYISDQKLIHLRNNIQVIFNKILGIYTSQDKDEFNNLIRSSVNEFLSLVHSSGLSQDNLSLLLLNLAKTYHRQDIVCIINAAICIIHATKSILKNPDSIKDIMIALMGAMKAAADSAQVFRPKYLKSLVKVFELLKSTYPCLEESVSGWTLQLHALEKLYSKNKEKQAACPLIVSHLDIQILDHVADVIEHMCKLCSIDIYVQLVAFELIHRASCSVDLTLKDVPCLAIASLLLGSKMSSERYLSSKLKKLIEVYSKLVLKKPHMKSVYEEARFKDEVLAIEKLFVIAIGFEFTSRVVVGNDNYLRRTILKKLQLDTDVAASAEKILESREYKCSSVCVQFSQGAIVCALLKCVAKTKFIHLTQATIELVEAGLSEGTVFKVLEVIQACQEDLKRCRSSPFYSLAVDVLMSPQIEDANAKVTPADLISPNDSVTHLTVPHTLPSLESIDKVNTVDLSAASEEGIDANEVSSLSSEFYEHSFMIAREILDLLPSQLLTNLEHSTICNVSIEQRSGCCEVFVRGSSSSQVSELLVPILCEIDRVVSGKARLREFEPVAFYTYEFALAGNAGVPALVADIYNELLSIERDFNALLLFKTETDGRVLARVCGSSDLSQVKPRLENAIVSANENKTSDVVKLGVLKVNSEVDCMLRLREQMEASSAYYYHVFFLKQSKSLWSCSKLTSQLRNMQRPSLVHIVVKDCTIKVLGLKLHLVTDVVGAVSNLLSEIRTDWNKHIESCYGYSFVIPAACTTLAREIVHEAETSGLAVFNVEALPSDSTKVRFDMRDVQCMSNMPMWRDKITNAIKQENEQKAAPSEQGLSQYFEYGSKDNRHRVQGSGSSHIKIRLRQPSPPRQPMRIPPQDAQTPINNRPVNKPLLQPPPPPHRPPASTHIPSQSGGSDSVSQSSTVGEEGDHKRLKSEIIKIESVPNAPEADSSSSRSQSKHVEVCVTQGKSVAAEPQLPSLKESPSVALPVEMKIDASSGDRWRPEDDSPGVSQLATYEAYLTRKVFEKEDGEVVEESEAEPVATTSTVVTSSASTIVPPVNLSRPLPQTSRKRSLDELEEANRMKNLLQVQRRDLLSVKTIVSDKDAGILLTKGKFILRALERRYGLVNSKISIRSTGGEPRTLTLFGSSDRDLRSCIEDIKRRKSPYDLLTKREMEEFGRESYNSERYYFRR